MFDYVNEDKLNVNLDTNSMPLQPDKFERLDPNLPVELGATSVLYFEFVDGELRPKLNKNPGYVLGIFAAELFHLDRSEIDGS
jgi:hypothetical protein